MEAHIKQSETVFVKRSQLKYSAYNPKRHSKEQINQIKKNIKSVAFLGGIVWNSLTGNLIDGHKRVMALDIIHGYNGNSDTDYEIKVEKIQLDTKTEKEQNIFQTQSRSQLELDLLRDMIPDIDYKNAGLTDEDLSLIGFDVSMKTDVENDIAKQLADLNAPNEAQKAIDKADIKQKKEIIRQQAEEKAGNMNSYVMLNFETLDAKRAFMLRFGFNEDDSVIKGEVFENMIEKIG